MNDSMAIGFDQLTKDNYRTWRMKAEASLEVCDLWDHVDKDKESSAVDTESWMKEDRIAKSILILHVSSSLLPLLENCKTACEVWLKLENVCGNPDEDGKDLIDDSEDNDEDVIVSAIEDSVEDFFNIINDLSEKKVMDNEKSLSSTLTDNLFLRLKKDNVGKLPDKKNIVNTVSDFINVIGELSKIEIEKQKNELCCKLIDSLLLVFEIHPHKNNNDEAESEADAAEIRDDNVNGDKKKNYEITSQEIPLEASEDSQTRSEEMLNTNLEADEETESETESEPENDIVDEFETPFDMYYGRPEFVEQVNDERFPCKLGNSDSTCSFIDLNTPPPTPTLEKTRKCGVCREEGHNRTTCPMNKSVASEPKTSASKTTESPKRSYKCGVCREEGHNRTTCPMNKSVASEPKTSASKTTESPKRSYKCGVCREEGHNRTTCPMNKSVASEPKTSASKTTESPKRSYKCGVCREEGHNRTTCPMNKSVASEPKTSASKTTESPKRSYKCGVCREEGHNRTTCPMNKSAVFESKTSASKATESPKRSYKCGVCREEGHNRTTCPMNNLFAIEPKTAASTATESPRSYKCGICGQQGHNRRTCGLQTSSPSSHHMSIQSPSSSYSGGGRSYKCSNCGVSGKNSTSYEELLILNLTTQQLDPIRFLFYFLPISTQHKNMPIPGIRDFITSTYRVLQHSSEIVQMWIVWRRRSAHRMGLLSPFSGLRYIDFDIWKYIHPMDRF
ncbi:uncharacterized protein LOC124406369 [Diprion similis]|uniref:uncharacterized protein LOC124406369 n=1 Tax=Diprion similis TaxID=362088 RepID=UPI001EF86F5F|nr:uncharacterized protein LOC124406369 [Diprion similis]